MAIDAFDWRPTTLQYTEKYIAVAYANDIDGTGFSFDPRNKAYFGLWNTTNITPSTDPNDYQWFEARVPFGTDYYLCYINRSSRKFSFDNSTASYNGSFVPTDTEFDQILWSALPDGTNIIDLDLNTGQKTQVGITTATAQSGQLTIENTETNQLKVSLQKIFDFNGGTFTGSATTVTIDETGRVVGFDAPDDFFMTIDNFTATSGQTVFTPTTRGTGYFTGQDLIYKNGILLTPTSDYTENGTTFTLTTGATTGDKITCTSFRAQSAKKTFINTGLTVDTVSGADVYWDAPTMPHQLIYAGDEFSFDNLSPPTVYTVSSVDYANRKITFTTSVTAFTGNIIYNHRDAGDYYRVFSRFDEDLVGASTYTPSLYYINNGFENLFLNGSSFNDQDYDISGNTINNMPAVITGKITNIQLNANNFNLAAGSPNNLVTYFVTGQTIYAFSSTIGGLNIYANGVLYVINSDYTATTANYTLATTPDNSLTILNQQTFARTGAA